MQWRKWFRQTSSHNTLTINHTDIQTTDSKTLLWKPEGDIQVLVTENQSYEKLKHRRSIFFVEGKYFVIVDEAVGAEKGTVNLHYQLPRGKCTSSRTTMEFTTMADDGVNVKLKCFGPEGMEVEKLDGWVSSEYMKKVKRPHFSFNVKKMDNKPVRYITVIMPGEGSIEDTKISASFIDPYFKQNSLSLMVKVGKNKKKVLTYELK
jgi:heparan-sulfate lyase